MAIWDLFVSFSSSPGLSIPSGLSKLATLMPLSVFLLSSSSSLSSSTLIPLVFEILGRFPTSNLFSKVPWTWWQPQQWQNSKFVVYPSLNQYTVLLPNSRFAIWSNASMDSFHCQAISLVPSSTNLCQIPNKDDGPPTLVLLNLVVIFW